MVFSFILSLKSELFEGIDKEKVSEVLIGNKKTLDYNSSICLSANLLHKELLNEVENNIKELHVNDEKISRLMLMKTVELEVENKALQENNEEIRKNLEILKESLTQSQNQIECLKKSYKMLKLEKNNLLAKLESTKEIKMYNKRLSGNESEKSDDNIHEVQSTNCISVKGTLFKL